MDAFAVHINGGGLDLPSRNLEALAAIHTVDRFAADHPREEEAGRSFISALRVLAQPSVRPDRPAPYVLKVTPYTGLDAGGCIMRPIDRRRGQNGAGLGAVEVANPPGVLDAVERGEAGGVERLINS